MINEPQTIEIQAQPDHISSLAKVNPISALLEMIWNALDADAHLITISVLRDAMGGTTGLLIQDDGEGLQHEKAQEAFGFLGGSWKKYAHRTNKESRILHGREGKGRFKALALGSKACWDITYRLDGDLFRYEIRMADSDISHCQIAPPERAKASGTGTTVKISDLSAQERYLVDEAKLTQTLGEHLALYLRQYPNVVIRYEAQEIKPSQFEKAFNTYTLTNVPVEPGKNVSAELEIVEWTIRRERRLYLCRHDGFTVYEVEMGVRPGSEFYFTAYIRSAYVEELEEQHRLELGELDSGLNMLLAEARKVIKKHFREKKALAATELVSAWKREGIYPYTDEPKDEIETAKRQVFDICAFNVNEYVADFGQIETASKKLTFLMLREALEDNPSALRRILAEVLSLPLEKQEELAEILEETSLAGIIEASKLVTDRLTFLKGLEELLFDSESKKQLKERSQLHKILEKESWIFGEEYHLTASDEGLTTVLKKHIKKLRPGEAIEEVARDDGSAGTIDLLLAREVPQPGKEKRDFLVVELKRPSQKIDLEVKNQIESYALAVVRDERFDKNNTSWTFLAVSNDISPDALETIDQVDKPFGFFLKKDHYRVGLITWAQVLQKCRTRMELFRDKLGYNATRDAGLDLLREKYAKYLPEALLQKEGPTSE